MSKKRKEPNVASELLSYIPILIIGIITIIAGTFLQGFSSAIAAEVTTSGPGTSGDSGISLILLSLLGTVVFYIGLIAIILISFLMLYTVIKWGIIDGNKKKETASETNVNPEEFEK